MSVTISEQHRINFMNTFNADTVRGRVNPNEVALPDGSRRVFSDEEYGAYVRENFTVLYFMFQEYFAKYRTTRAMAPLLERLNTGLDDISLEYIERHEQLLDVLSGASHCLVAKNFVYTEEDFKRLAYYEQCKAEHPENLLLHKLSLDLGSIMTNKYGLYDLPEPVLSTINGKDIIDAGAFVGDNIWLFRSEFPQSKVYCFEPDPLNFKYLTAMSSHEIEAGTVMAFNLGLGEEHSTLHLSRIPELKQANQGSSFFYDFNNSATPDPANSAEVEVVTVDEMVAQHNLKVGLIKMDVEGFEPHIVRGALNTLRTQRPVLAICIYHTPEEFYELKPFIEDLNLGYKFRIRHTSVCSAVGELVLIAYPDD